MSQFRSKFNKYDKTFSEYIRLRDKVCQWCGKDKRLECSHIFSRKNMGVRCDPDNAKGLCNYCHRKWHSEPVMASQWLITVIGDAAYDRLCLKANKPTKMTVFDKDLIRRDQQEQIDAMNDGTLDVPCFNPRFR